MSSPSLLTCPMTANEEYTSFSDIELMLAVTSPPPFTALGTLRKVIASSRLSDSALSLILSVIWVAVVISVPVAEVEVDRWVDGPSLVVVGPPSDFLLSEFDFPVRYL